MNIFKKLNSQVEGAGKKDNSGRKRRALYGGYSVVLTAVVIVAVLLVNIVLQYLGTKVNLQVDMTQNQVFSITNKTNKIVTELDEDVYIYTLFTGAEIDQGMVDILNLYKPLSDHIKIENVDPVLNPGFVSVYSKVGEVPIAGDVVVTNAAKNVYRVVSYDDMYTYDGDENLTQVNVESQITAAINYVTAENRRTAYVLPGHGESDITMLSTFNDILKSENLEIVTATMDEFVENHKTGDILVVLAPETDLTDEERISMKEFAENGGAILFALDNQLDKELANFKSILKLYGVSAPQGTIYEEDRNYYVLPMQNYIVPHYLSHDIVSALNIRGVSVRFPGAGPLVIDDPLPEQSMAVSILVESSKTSWVKAPSDQDNIMKADSDLSGAFPVGVAITEKLYFGEGDERETRIIAFNTVNHISYGSSLSAYADEDLLRNCMAWLKGETDSSEFYIRGKTIGDSMLYFQNASQVDWTIILTWPVPVALILIAALVVFIKRRHL